MRAPLIAGRALVLAAVLVLAAGCDSTTSHSASSSATPATSASPSPSSTATITPPVTAGIVVVATRAAPTPSGTVVFVVLSDDAIPRSAITVSVDATSANSRPPVSAETTLASIAPNATDAVMVRVAVPPGDSIGAVTAMVTSTGASTAPANPFSVGPASFVADPITPSVTVQVGTTTASTSAVLAVCYQGTTVVGGVIAQLVRVPAGRPTTVQLVAALTDTPTSCRGFAHPG